MKWLGFREIAIKSVTVNAADIRARQKTEHVGELAADIELRGGEPIHAPTVRVPGNVLLCGRDRFAASLLNGAKKLWVHAVECDDDEAKELELAENIYRRADNRADLMAQLVQLKEQHLRAVDDQKRAAGEKVSEAAKDSPKARARKEVARAAGVSTDAVVQAEKRAAKSAKQAEIGSVDPGTVSWDQTASPEPEEQAPVPLPEGFEAYGLETSDVLRERLAETVAWLGRLEADARRIVGEITKLEKASRPVAHAHIQTMRERAQMLGHAIRDAIPVGLCPYCKGFGDVVNCHGCGGTGVVGRHGADHAPPELKRTDAPMVARDGQVVPAPKKAPKPIRVDVVDEGGGTRELTLERSAAEESEELF